MIIEDGTGHGYKARVNSNNMVLEYAIGADLAHFENHENQRAYQVVIQQTPTGAGDCFYYLKILMPTYSAYAI